MAPIFRNPDLEPADRVVIDEIHDQRARLAVVLRAPRRWQGGLRRTLLARAIQGSNSIEGIVVDDDDAAAAVDDEAPLSADEQTWAEIIGYREALTYVLRMAGDAHFDLDASAIRAMHFMMLSHDLSKGPGQYRSGPIYVRDDRTGETVYEAPEAELVPALVRELVERLAADTKTDPLVRAAMAHLNLVMIHPFRDGNGRMSRALQTLVLARETLVEPQFSSIEEWLGRNTEDYYRVLALTGGGSWSPARDAGLWVRFALRAHHMQAQTIGLRVGEAQLAWARIDEIVRTNGLPDRVADVLYEAVLGYQIRRSSYVKRAGIELRTATRDLGRLVERGLLDAVGQTKGRRYVAGADLVGLRRELRGARPALVDPYPGLLR